MLDDRWDAEGWAEASPRRREPGLVRLVPLTVLERALKAARTVQRRRSGAGRWLETWEPREYDAPLAGAIDRAGGFEQVRTAQARLFAERYAARAAMVIAGERWWRSRARIVRAELLPVDGPCIVVVPHLGLPMLPQGHLLSLGRRVCTPAYDPTGRVISDLRLLERFGFGSAERRFRVIRVPNVMLGLLAGRALERGYDLTWQPDTRVALTSERGVEVEFLGQTRVVSRLIHRLWAHSGVPVVAAAATVEESPDGSRHRLVYHRVPIDGESEAGFLRALYGKVEELILADVAYWTQLRFYPNV